MTTMMVRFRRAYGAHPLQLVLVLAGLALAGYVLQVLGLAALWNPDAWWQSIAVWFVGAALAHDLLLFPVYAAADRILTAAAARRPRRGRRGRAVPGVNYLRVPLLACGLISVMFFPGIIRQGAGSYNRATGQTQEPFLHRWLILCALILLAGLLVYLAALATTRRRPAWVPDAATDAAAAPTTTTSAAPRVGGPAPTWAVVLALVLVGLAVGRRRRRGRPGDTAR